MEAKRPAERSFQSRRGRQNKFRGTSGNGSLIHFTQELRIGLEQI